MSRFRPPSYLAEPKYRKVHENEARVRRLHCFDEHEYDSSLYRKLHRVELFFVFSLCSQNINATL